MLKPAIQAAYLRALKDLDLFEGQTQLEDDLFSSYSAKLITLPLEQNQLSIEYARVRGALEVLKQLRANRDMLVNSAVEKTLNS